MSALESICAEEDVSWCELGTVSDYEFTIGSAIDLPLSELESAWRNALEARL